MNGSILGMLTCPACGASPQPGRKDCPGCGRSLIAAGGGFDLLADDSKDAADRFARAYRELRIKEGWADTEGREDPLVGNARLWRSRFDSVSSAVAVLHDHLIHTRRPVIADIGAGGGWAARRFSGADIVAIDLLDTAARPGAVTVRGDMRKLPLRDDTIDAALYSASLHYSPVVTAVSEAARVLRPGGLIVAVDSPIYRDVHSQATAAARSIAYYAEVGFPELADHYHPIEAGALRSALVASGFQVMRLDAGRRRSRVWRRLARRPPSSLVIARLSHEL